jgi:hypothetical protein
VDHQEEKNFGLSSVIEKIGSQDYKTYTPIGKYRSISSKEYVSHFIGNSYSTTEK